MTVSFFFFVYLEINITTSPTTLKLAEDRLCSWLISVVQLQLNISLDFLVTTGNLGKICDKLLLKEVDDMV
jgi:hypothetical protein